MSSGEYELDGELSVFHESLRRIINFLSDVHEDPSDVIEDADEMLKEAIQLANILTRNRLHRSTDSESTESDAESEDEDVEGLHVRTNILLKKGLPEIVSALLERRFRDDEVRDKVNQFLQCVLDVVIAYIPIADLEENLKICREIFDDDAKFYFETESWEGAAHLPETFAAMPEEDWQCQTSALLVENINYFGRKGGFEAILNRISSCVPCKIEIQTLNLLLTPIYQVRKLLTPTFASEWIPHLKNAVFRTFLEIPDQELKEIPKKSISYMIKLLDALLPLGLSASDAGELMEKFRLNVALKCLNCGSFEKRLNGIMEINELVEMVFNKEERFRWTGSSSSTMAQWLNGEFLIQWITEHQILERIFGAFIHSELVNRSVEIFMLFAKYSKIDENVLNLLWDSSLGKQETTVESVYKVIGRVAPHLSTNLLDYLFLKVSILPPSGFDKKLLQLMETLLRCALSDPNYTKEQEGGKWLGLELLWRIVQDEVKGVPDDIRQGCLLLLESSLDSPRIFFKKEPFIIKCIENLKIAQSVPVSLELLKNIIENYSPEDTEIDSNLILRLEEKYKLLELLFEELLQYKSKAAARSALSPAQPTVEAQFVYQLKARLEFLNYIVINSDLSLTVQQLSILWETLILKALTPEELDVGFKCFRVYCSKAKRIFKNYDTVCCYILVDKLGSLDAQNLTENGLSCFWQYFRFVNANRNKISNVECGDIVVQDMKLIGLETLWRFALHTRDELVAKNASSFLNSLYSTQSPSIEQKEQLHLEFLRTVMTNLDGVSEETPNSHQIIERTIAMLTVSAL